MSNYLAIATVTATLKQILESNMGFDFPGAVVTTVRPDNVDNTRPNMGVNIFLYQVTPNAALRNADLPTRGHEGAILKRPQVALDLHYLISFYGDENQLQPQFLLGSVVRTLHVRPMLSKEAIRNAIADPLIHLSDSTLADQIESVKFVPLSLSLEDLSKLWSIFFQTPYALSVAYMATVVLIEGEAMPRAVLPVREPGIYTMPFRKPVIEKIASQDGEQMPLTPGTIVEISGRHLRGDMTRVSIGGLEVTPHQEDIKATKISFPLAEPPFAPGTLRAGVQGLQVTHHILMGDPKVPHRGFESNMAVLLLRPVMTLVGSPNTEEIKIKFNPKVGRTQRVLLLLNEHAPPSDRLARAYSFDAPPDNGISDFNINDTEDISFTPLEMKPGNYYIRVQVDGADSVIDPIHPVNIDDP